VLPLRTAKIAAEVEKIILNMGQHIANHNIIDMQHGDADDRVGFVDAAIGGDARVELRQARPVAERCAAVIAGAGVNPIEFHGGCPMRASWTARSRISGVAKCAALFKSSSRALLNGSGPLDPQPSRPASSSSMVPFGDQKGTR